MSQSGQSGNGNSVIWPPNQAISWVDDFFPNDVTLTDFGQLIWQGISGNVTEVSGNSAHPGQLQFTNGGGGSGICLADDPTVYPIVLGGGSWEVNFVVSLNTLSDAGNRYIANAGLMDNLVQDGVPNNGVYLSYSDNLNSGKWLLVCKAGGFATTVDSGIAATTGWVNLGFRVNPAASSVSFTINGAPVGSAITTNIPSAVVGPGLNFIGFVTNSLLDLFYMRFTATTPR